MHDFSGSGVDYRFKSIDEELIGACREHTGLSPEEIDRLLEVSHNLAVVHELEGGDIFIDSFTKDSEAAVVVAQFSPVDSNYTRNIVGELMLRNNEPGVFRTLEIGVPSRELKAVVTGNYIIRQNVSAIRSVTGRIIGVLIVERHLEGGELWSPLGDRDADANLLKTAYDAHETERVAEYMKDGMVRFNQKGIAVYANPRARQIFRNIDYMDDILGMRFENLAFGKISFSEIETKGFNAHTEVQIGGYILNVVYAPLRDKTFNGAVMLIEDTTEEKKIEKELILKSAAIDEIHHRVKNNLQTIISLLRLQSRRIENPDARVAFSDTISRIFSISLTHEILAQKGVDDVDLKEMLGRMINSAKGYIIPENLELAMEISGDSILLKSDTATSIALVVNELLQNSIKHAFTGRVQGRVSLAIIKGEPHSAIEIHDDGIGYNQGKVRPGSLGHKLVQSLVEDKLFGRIRIDSSASTGTTVRFTFLRDAEKRHKKIKDKSVLLLLEEEKRAVPRR